MKAFWGILIAISMHVQLQAQTYTAVQSSAISQSYVHEANMEYGRAIAMLRQAGFAPGDYFSNLRLGWLVYLKKDYPDAVAAYRIAISAEPTSIEAHVGLMNALYAMRDNAGLESVANTLLSFDPANYYAHRYLIQLDIDLGEYSKAELRALSAQKLYPIDLTLNLNLARIYHQQGRRDDVRNLLMTLEAIYGLQNAEIVSFKEILKR